MASPNSRPSTAPDWRLNLLKQRMERVRARTPEEGRIHFKRLINQARLEDAWKVYTTIAESDSKEEGLNGLIPYDPEAGRKQVRSYKD